MGIIEKYDKILEAVGEGISRAYLTAAFACIIGGVLIGGAGLVYAVRHPEILRSKNRPTNTEVVRRNRNGMEDIVIRETFYPPAPEPNVRETILYGAIRDRKLVYLTEDPNKP
jgi:hypothetical protein